MQYNEVTGPFRREPEKRTFQKRIWEEDLPEEWEENFPEESLGREPSRREPGKRTLQRRVWEEDIPKKV